MTRDEMALYEQQMRSAESEEERRRIRDLWWGHFIKCLANTSERVKDIQQKLDQICAMISAYHGQQPSKPQPSKPQGRPSGLLGKRSLPPLLAWFTEHWWKLLIAAYFLKSLGLEELILRLF